MKQFITFTVFLFSFTFVSAQLQPLPSSNNQLMFDQIRYMAELKRQEAQQEQYQRTNNDRFCKGFEEGYCEAYKDANGNVSSFCPTAPVCAVPPVGCDYSDYKCGYNQGFKAGMREAYSR